MELISQNKLNPEQKKKATLAVLILMVAIPIVIFSISGGGESVGNEAPSAGQELSYLCSKEYGGNVINYYLVNSVAVVGKTVSLPNTLKDLTVKMSRYPSKSGWDTNTLCDSNKIDLPESDWRILSIGSDCEAGAAITACDIDTIANERGVTGLHIFPLKNGYYSGASGKIERGTLIKVTGRISQ